LDIGLFARPGLRRGRDESAEGGEQLVAMLLAAGGVIPGDARVGAGEEDGWLDQARLVPQGPPQ
jgi:hypothetical protein